MFIDRGPVPLSAIRRGGAKVRILERTFIPPPRMAPEVGHRCGYKHLTPPGQNPTQTGLLQEDP